MKKLIIILLLTGFFHTGCGSGGAGGTLPPMDPPVKPPVVVNTVGFSCLSVDNDFTCSGVLDEPGVWNSGPVVISGGIPLPEDFLNLEVSSMLATNSTVFIHATVTISGCGDQDIAFPAVTLEPGGSVIQSGDLWNVRCGHLGLQETLVTLYNASGFDPAHYPNPWTYPRTDAITNAIVRWDNVLPGSI